MIRDKKINFKKVKEKLPQTEKIFAKYSDKLVVAYLFGSLAAGTVRPLSDIDIALLFDFGLAKETINELALRIEVELTEFLGTDEIDVLILNHQPPSRRFAVLRNRRILFCSDQRKRIDFETATVMTYLDFQPFREEFNREFLKSLGGKAHG